MNTYNELKDRWHSEHLKMLVASDMTVEEGDMKATVYANNQILELTKTNKSGPSGLRRPALDIQKCKHCPKLYMSEQSLNNHLNKDRCNMNGDFSIDLLNTDGRIGLYLPEARKVRIAQFHAKHKMRLWRKVVVRRTKKRKINKSATATIKMTVNTISSVKKKLSSSSSTKKKPQMKYDPDVPMTKEEAAVLFGEENNAARETEKVPNQFVLDDFRCVLLVHMCITICIMIFPLM
jgi:hypothetical protein